MKSRLNMVRGNSRDKTIYVTKDIILSYRVHLEQ